MQKYLSSIILVLATLSIVVSSLWSPGGIVLLDYVLTDNAPISL
jgi:hypothetical protein